MSIDTQTQAVRRKPWLYLVAAAGVVTLIVVGTLPRIGRHNALQAADEGRNSAKVVTVLPAKRASAESELMLPAAVSPIETAVIYARINGVVRELRVDIGDKVQAGQLLVLLDAPELEADVRRAEARLNEAQRNATLADATNDRFNRLAEAGATSKQQSDEALARKNSAEALTLSNKADLDRLKAQFAYRQITAPFAGVVTKRNIDKGALINAGAGLAGIMEISRLDTLRVFADVPQSYAESVHVGDKATIVDGPHRIEAKVVRTANALDPQTRMMRVEAHMPGDKGVLSGSFVRVAFAARSAEPPVLVPANALVSRGKGLLVFVVEADNKVREQQVMLGRELGTTAEVISGLQGDERLVVNVPENLASGTTVRIAETAGAKP